VEKAELSQEHEHTTEIVNLRIVYSLYGDDIRSVRRSCSDGRHDGNEYVFLDGEWTRINRNTKNLDIRQEFGPGLTEGKGEQLGNDAENGDRRISEKEELVQTLFQEN
jgi:hypothetical protein